MVIKYSNKQQGIALVEVVITLAVFAVGILGFLSMQGRVTALSSHTNLTSQAQMIAQKTMESLRADTNFNNVTSTVTQNIANTPFQINRTVVTTGSDTSAYKTVTITVSWQDRTGATKSVVNTSIISYFDAKKSASFFNDPLAGGLSSF